MIITKPTKIHIIGSVGSGKTTLAKKLSSQFNVPYYELDNVVWKRSSTGDIRRTDEDRDELLNKIVQSDHWIIEGVHHKWISPSLHNADVIIFLDTDYSIRRYRIIKRFILQKLGLEKANYKPTLKIFKDMFKWNAQFEINSKPEIMNMLSLYENKLVIAKEMSDVTDGIDFTDISVQSICGKINL